ncbi:MAG: PLP-dependent aminotransferase family protein, partial [Kofleriaceae bacterium]|nr:PLP-dependent aminotransferase family protein [Kofleriaceae bacterium]
MELHLSLGRHGRLASDVYRQLLAAIRDGRLRPGDQLPATRQLAKSLEVSRNTVLDAYQRLTAEGFLVGRAGAGTFVSPEAASRVRAASSDPRTIAKRRDRPAALTPAAAWRGAVVSPSLAPAAFDFRIGIPDPALFPWDEWRRAVAHQLHSRRRARASYPEAHGVPRLRAAIARSVGLSRGVRTTADQIVVTSGAQQAFDLIARVLVEPGATVAVEEPGYPPAHAALRAAGARVEPVPVDGEGIVVSALPPHTRLVYVTPSHQFPLGHVMSLRRRQELLSFCAA